MTLHAPRAACCLYRFGAGWWCLIDALVYSRVVLNESYPFTYNLPGIIATVALIMMNLVSRDDLANMGDSYSSDEGSEVSNSLILLIVTRLFASREEVQGSVLPASGTC